MPGVGEVDEGTFRAGPEFFSFCCRNALCPNRLQLPGKQQSGPLHFSVVSLLTVCIPVKICPLNADSFSLLAAGWYVLAAWPLCLRVNQHHGSPFLLHHPAASKGTVRV